MIPLLLLFDIDGTLLAGATEAHAAALHTALREVHGLHEVERERTRGIDPAGRTDPEIARAILLAHDVSAERIDARADDVRIAASEVYAQTCPADLSDKVLPGVPELLAQLAARDDVRLALVTGNYETIARVKLRAAGIGHWFDGGPGGFGSDSEDRTDLPGIARMRAAEPSPRGVAAADQGAWELPATSRGDDPPSWNSQSAAHPRERAVVIGDTPRDVACALADGVRCIGVETGRFKAADLHGATSVAPGAHALAPLIDALV
ncbi:HAD family hydrolase [Conexibacter sp. CPCC 206217]|uniref:HAD family hydrolase n=1 Tax=Conexibacter sp. CPCC 206217 TaxID=3064574 RepID=UPI002728D449|nr:HAD family hydrolase [Conexibacter sp. CPCC 206217]MDO8211831.1 HAD family hydrolase [Conexibacter sp. CPCC 206217]